MDNFDFLPELQLEPMRVLCIDDDSVIRTIVQTILERFGFTVATSARGEEGVYRCKRFRPHLILLDISMPGIDGFETCARLRAQPPARAPRVKIVFLTGSGSREYVAQAAAAGADGYLVKPFKPAELVRRVSTALSVPLLPEHETLLTELEGLTYADGDRRES